MSRTNLDRVIFFSKEDSAYVHYFKKVESLLDNVNFNQDFEINDILEFYNIKKYFDNEIYIPTWDDSTKDHFKKAVNQLWLITRKYFLTISNQTIINELKSIEYGYKKDFWELISNLHIYKQIDQETFSSVLKNEPFHVDYILKHKILVTHFSAELKSFLINYEKSAELLLSNFEQDHKHDFPNLHFPKSLSLSDREEIISKYIDRDDANLNFISLIVYSNSNELKISTRTKLKAKKREETLGDSLLQNGTSWKVGVHITLSEDQTEPVKYSSKDGILEVSYSKKFLDQHNTHSQLFSLFERLFRYTDNEGLITLVSKESELDVMETIFMKSKNEYSMGEKFYRKDILSIMQIALLDYHLTRNKDSIENVIESFIAKFLNVRFPIKDLRFKFAKSDTGFLEKIRIIAPEFDFLLKQYQLYVQDGKIDFELLEFSSEPLRLSEINSLVSVKYVYANSPEIGILKSNFFSDQSMLYYVEPFKEKYNNLYDLLTNENVRFEDFKDYQKDGIKYFVDKKYLYIDSDDFVKINNEILLFIVSQLNKNGVLSYWHYPLVVRNSIDEMLNSSLLISESKLLSKQEIMYFNYHLNKREFTNGLDLRNKYLHGTNTSSEEKHKTEYYILLKLIVLILFKMKDDLLICEYANNNTQNINY